MHGHKPQPIMQDPLPYGHGCMRQEYLVAHKILTMQVEHSWRLIYDVTFYHPIAVYIKLYMFMFMVMW